MATNTYWFTPEQLEKVINRIEPQDNGCWWYPAVPHKEGYATTRIGWPVTKGAKIHRLSWIYYRGDIPEGMVIDHTCHDPKVCKGGKTCEHRRCVNPDHMELVTQQDNTLRSSRLLRHMDKCVHGHDLKDNVYIYERPTGTLTICKSCRKEQGKKANLGY